MGNALRPHQFTPFIPYNFEYVSPKLPLGTQFSFEDAGNGLAAE